MILSVIIPAAKDPYLQKTIDCFLETSELGDEVEILAVIDGPWLEKPLKEDKRVRVIQLPENVGMRGAINIGLKEAIGRFIMKVDSHCLFDQGFDRIMIENCADNWLLIPRRYSLDEETWTRDFDRPFRDYHYFSSPHLGKYGLCMEVLDWIKRNNKDIDDTMAFQGSCWLANRDYFMSHVGFLDDRIETYGSFAGDQHEIGLKYWFSGGEIKVNKKTWYAHLSKRAIHYLSGFYDRERKKDTNTIASHTWTTNHWVNDLEPNMIHNLRWLIEKFSPVPTWGEEQIDKLKK